MKKWYISFFIAGSVLLLPVTSYYAIDWQSLKDKAAAVMNKETLQKYVTPEMIAALGLAAGAYYLLMHNNGGKGNPPRRTDVNSTNSIGTDDHAQAILNQFDVYSQFNFGGGGGASCGYQTLLRGMQVVNTKSEHESDQVLQNVLNDSTPIAAYFGPDGTWRRDIIARRKEQKLKDIMHEKFILTLRPHCDEIIINLYGEEPYAKIMAESKKQSIRELGDKARDLYTSALGYLESVIVVISSNPQQLIQQYDFTDQGIQYDLQKSLEQLKNPINKNLVAILQLPEVISQCFNLDRMREEFLSQEFLFNLPALMQQIYRNPEFKEDFTGEWLSDGEVEYLWENKKDEFIPRGVQCGFKAVANFELVGNRDIPIEFDEVALYVRDNVKPFLNKKRQIFQVFALGTMKQYSGTSGSRGHWYPLVMYQNQEGTRKYYIMDSASNANRRNDTNAWKIINLIEQ
jgi:hypothetical protein